MRIRLWKSMPCAKCGEQAELRFGEYRVTLISGAALVVKEVPEYACAQCGYVQRELLASASVQEAVDRYLDHNHPTAGHLTLRLEWDLSAPRETTDRHYQEGSPQPIPA